MDFEKLITEKYRFVLLRAPYEIMDFDVVQKIFPALIQLKTSGYRQEYQKHVLPFDSSDFVASHLLMCEKNGRDLKPVLGMKSVTLRRCDDHRISFPMLSMLERIDSDLNSKAPIQKILDSYRLKGTEEKIAYNGSFTILPHLREDKVLMKYLWEVSFSLLANYYIDYEIDHVLAVCATKFKVNKKKEEYGWNYISDGGSTLEEYHCKALFGAPLVPMELFTSSERCRQSATRFKSMWLNKVVLDVDSLTRIREAA
jgi:hypothetical protein